MGIVYCGVSGMAALDLSVSSNGLTFFPASDDGLSLISVIEQNFCSTAGMYLIYEFKR